jgi:hypothetical protein
MAHWFESAFKRLYVKKFNNVNAGLGQSDWVYLGDSVATKR